MQQTKTNKNQKTQNKRFVFKVNEENKSKKLHNNSFKKTTPKGGNFKTKGNDVKQQYRPREEKDLSKVIKTLKREIDFTFKSIPEERRPCIILRNKSNMEKMDKGLISLTTEIFNTTPENPNVPNGKPVTSISLYWVEKQTLSAAIIVNNNANNFVFQGSGKGGAFVIKVVKYLVKYLENTMKFLRYNSDAVTAKNDNTAK